MREIKFRVWSKPLGFISYEYPLNETDNLENLNEIFKNPDCVFMQFTGMTDEAGREIWEGDIILSESSAGIKAHVVVYGAKGFLAEGKNGNDNYFTPISIKDKVIGNIYDNPELVK